MSPYFWRHSNALTLDASRYSEVGASKSASESVCDYVKSFYYYMTLILTSLQCSTRTRVLWGSIIITLVVPNRPLGVDVLAINCKVEGYVGHTSNSAVYSSVPVPMNSQQTAKKIGWPSVPHARARQSYFEVDVLNNWQRSFKLAISNIIELECLSVHTQLSLKLCLFDS